MNKYARLQKVSRGADVLSELYTLYVTWTQADPTIFGCRNYNTLFGFSKIPFTNMWSPTTHNGC